MLQGVYQNGTNQIGGHKVGFVLYYEHGEDGFDGVGGKGDEDSGGSFAHGAGDLFFEMRIEHEGVDGAEYRVAVISAWSREPTSLNVLPDCAV